MSVITGIRIKRDVEDVATIPSEPHTSYVKYVSNVATKFKHVLACGKHSKRVVYVIKFNYKALGGNFHYFCLFRLGHNEVKSEIFYHIEAPVM